MKELIIKLFYGLGDSFIGRSLSAKYKGISHILMYHRVLPEPLAKKDAASIAISKSTFEAHIKFLCEHYKIISLDTLLETPLKTNKPPVVITFDDGYRDNFTEAYPILKKYNVPATIYITTSFPEQTCLLWWYELIDCCKEIDPITFNWQNTNYVLSTSTDKKRRLAYKKIHGLMMKETPNEQETLLKKIRGATPIKDYTKESMTWDEIQTLAKDPLITIAAHTHQHSILKNLDTNTCKEDIVEGKQLLESKLGIEIHHFAYPFGSANEAGEREYTLAKEIGFKSATTTTCKPLTNVKEYQYQLPRIAITYRTTVKNLRVKLSGWNAMIRGLQF